MTWQNFPDLADPALVAEAVIYACGERPVELIKRRQTRRRATYEVRFPDRVVFFKLEVSLAYGFPTLALEQWALEKAAQKRDKGTAQQATQARNVALRQLTRWHSDFVKIARVAFEDQPQRLEQLGIIVPSP